MQNNGINFTSYEKRIMKDTDFLLSKRKITAHISEIWNDLAKTIGSEQLYKTLSDVLNIQWQGAKISKGENYRGLPYIILDHPRFFNKEDILTFRSMFWWGNGYSFTLHVQGRFLELLKPGFLHLKFSSPTYISVGNTPWEYHFEEDNYVLINEKIKPEILDAAFSKGFIKLSRKLSIDASPGEVREKGLTSFRDLAQILVF